MTFELTINRVDAFAGTTPKIGKRLAEVEELFHHQLQALVAPDSPYHMAQRIIRSTLPSVKKSKSESDDDEAKLIRIRRLAVANTSRCPYGLSACWGGAYQTLNELSGVRFVKPLPMPKTRPRMFF